MKCLALLSGGKDSVAAIEVALGHGWDVVAGVRMVPAKDDSYMFHTPNLDVVEQIAAAMGMPLVSASTSDDPEQEIDELEQALARAKEQFNADAVISGALASEYQRTRIDRIGHRIGLQTFAPLWHKDPATYLASLAGPGYDVRFARVAADGLDSSWVGQRLDASRIAMLERMRMHPAGEGGEYETLVLDAPHYRERIEVMASHVEESASRATWHVTQTRRVPKTA